MRQRYRERKRERQVRTHLTNSMGYERRDTVGAPPEEQPSLRVSEGRVSGEREEEGGGGGLPGQTNPSEACLIVTEFPAGVTLKNHPQEEN